MAGPPRKAQLWQQLKTAQEMGTPIKFEKAYVSYTETELETLVMQYLGDTYSHEEPAQTPEFPALASGQAEYPSVTQAPAPVAEGTTQAQAELLAHPETWGQFPPAQLARLLGVPFSDEPSRRAGLTMNTHGPDDPVRVDSQGRVWYMDEVQKPAIPQPRMRRKIRYIETGVQTVERRGKDGHLDETFEVAGTEQREAEIKITLPSSQVGVYRDPRMPFKIHRYGDRRGFDRLDVVRFYGGSDLVPTSIGLLYVGGNLCYDINQTRDAIEREHREKILLGRGIYS